MYPKKFIIELMNYTKVMIKPYFFRIKILDAFQCGSWDLIPGKTYVITRFS